MSIDDIRSHLHTVQETLSVIADLDGPEHAEDRHEAIQLGILHATMAQYRITEILVNEVQDIGERLGRAGQVGW